MFRHSRGPGALLMMHCRRSLNRRRFWQSPRAGRNPMFVFAFDRGLFKFVAASPALLPLFQLPPRYGRRSCTRPLLHLLEPAPDDSPDFVEMPGPNLVFLERQNTEILCHSDLPTKQLKVRVHVAKRRFLVVSLCTQHRAPHQAPHREPNFLAHHMPFRFGEMRYSLIAVAHHVFNFLYD